MARKSRREIALDLLMAEEHIIGSGAPEEWGVSCRLGVLFHVSLLLAENLHGPGHLCREPDLC
jgi:hypothetical protein